MSAAYRETLFKTAITLCSDIVSKINRLLERDCKLLRQLGALSPLDDVGIDLEFCLQDLRHSQRGRQNGRALASSVKSLEQCDAITRSLENIIDAFSRDDDQDALAARLSSTVEALTEKTIVITAFVDVISQGDSTKAPGMFSVSDVLQSASRPVDEVSRSTADLDLPPRLSHDDLWTEIKFQEDDKQKTGPRRTPGDATGSSSRSQPKPYQPSISTTPDTPFGTRPYPGEIYSEGLPMRPHSAHAFAPIQPYSEDPIPRSEATGIARKAARIEARPPAAILAPSTIVTGSASQSSSTGPPRVAPQHQTGSEVGQGVASFAQMEAALHRIRSRARRDGYTVPVQLNHAQISRLAQDPQARREYFDALNARWTREAVERRATRSGDEDDDEEDSEEGNDEDEE